MSDKLSPAILGGIGTGMQSSAQLASGNAAAARGESQKVAAEYQAQQLDTNAGQAQASSQRAAIEAQRQSMLIQSRAIALSAASGGGALDPTVMALVSGMSKEGQLSSDTLLYGGAEAARGMKEQAKATRYQGEQQRIAGKTAQGTSRIQTAGTILSSISKDWGGNGFRDTYRAPISDSTTVFTGN